MGTTIKAQKVRDIPGVGYVLEFIVIGGVVKSGMKFESDGETFEIGDRMLAFTDSSVAEKSMMLGGVSDSDYRTISEARPNDNIIQANIKTTAKNPIEKLLDNKEGSFILK